jgi:hypothetical protein
MARKRLGEILVQVGALDPGRLRAALVEQRRWGGQLGRILVDMGMITEDALVQALATQINFPVIKLTGKNISPDVTDLVSGELAEQHSLIPFNVDGKFLDVAMSDPTNLGIIDELRIRTQLNVRPYLCGPKQIEKALARFYGRGMATLGVAEMDPRDPRMTGSGSHEFPDGIDVIDLESNQQPGAAAASGGADPGTQASRRAAMFDLAATASGNRTDQDRDKEIVSLQERISKLEALVTRDEDVLRKVLGLMVEKGIATREEILERIK